MDFLLIYKSEQQQKRNEEKEKKKKEIESVLFIQFQFFLLLQFYAVIS